MNVTRDDLMSWIIPAVSNAVGSFWPVIRELAEPELRRLAEDLLDIYWMLDAEKIDQRRARALVHVHQRTLRRALHAIEGIGIRTVRQVPRIATRAVGAVINELVGFELIGKQHTRPKRRVTNKQSAWGRTAPKSEPSEEATVRSAAEGGSTSSTPDFRAGKDI